MGCPSALAVPLEPEVLMSWTPAESDRRLVPSKDLMMSPDLHQLVPSSHSLPVCLSEGPIGWTNGRTERRHWTRRGRRWAELLTPQPGLRVEGGPSSGCRRPTALPWRCWCSCWRIRRRDRGRSPPSRG